MPDYATLHDQITTILAEGLTADAVADAICAAVGLEKPAPAPSDPLPQDDPAVTGVPRDETHDSIDQATGTLTAEAQAARQKLADDQAKLAADQATAAADQAKLDDDNAVIVDDNTMIAADNAALGGQADNAVNPLS